MSAIRVLSLGAGVQSTTLALLAAHGEIEPPDVAIFADTHWEPAAVYAHLQWLMSPNVLPFPIRIVSAGDIRDGIRTRRSARSGRFAAVPWHLVNPDGSLGMGKRQCSAEYKLEPIAAEVRRLLGKPHPMRIEAGAATMLIGISLDEIQRVKPARRKYMINTYPLIDLGMRRWDCLRWLERHDYPRPPKSACIGCPYTSNERWRDRRDNQPEEWLEAIEMDRVLREGDARAMKGVEFMHRSCMPLDDVDLEIDDRQLDLFTNECDGVCGV
jgi:hypothetical protein